MPADDFYVAPQARTVFAAAAARNEQLRTQWHAAWKAWESKNPEPAKAWNAFRSREVPADLLEKEKAIYRGQMEGTGKPANVIEKIVEGKLGSFYSQVVLIDQPSIREPKLSVADVLAAANKSFGTSIAVTRFARLKVGETAQA